MLLFICFLAYFRYQAHIALGLLGEVRNLKIGQSTTADVLPIVHRYGGVGATDGPGHVPCPPDNCSYFLHLTPLDGEGHGRIILAAYEVAGNILNWEGTRYLGIRPWFVGSVVTLENGKVKDYSGSVLVGGPCQKLLHAGWEVAQDFPNHGHSGEPWPNKVSDSLMIQWHGVTSYQSGEGIQAYLTPAATVEERQAAFDINMDCLTRMGNGCFLLRDILPEGVRWQLAHGGGLGYTGHTCRGLKDPQFN
jgi:hypothetical protein